MHLSHDAEIVRRFHYPGKNVRTLFKQWVDTQPHKIFFHWHPFHGNGASWSYAEFWGAVCAFASGLQRNGIRPGERVIIHSDNCPEMLVAWYGCAVVNVVAVTTNTGAVPGEMAHYIDKADPVAAVTQPKYMELLGGFSSRFRWMAVTEDNSGEPAPEPGRAGFIPFSEFQDCPREPEFPAPDPLARAGILYTSGTTGLPKAVVHTHANVLWAAETGASNIDMRNGDVMLTYMPLFHTNAQLWATATVLGVGASMVLLPRVTVSRFWPIIQRYGVTHLSLMPLLLEDASGKVPPHHSLRQVGLFESQQLSRAWGTRFSSTYGSSELVTHAIRSDLHRSWPDAVLGQPAPGYQVQIVDPETGLPCEAGESGELWVRGVRGVQLFLEYFNDQAATLDAFSGDGWFKTGDLVRLGEDGNLYYQQRLKDMIKVGGENVGAAEIEGVIAALPEVREVAVVAKKDASLQEVPVAFIICDPDTDRIQLEHDVIESCREKLASFKVPRHIVLVDDFPRALLNKVAKNQLRTMADAL